MVSWHGHDDGDDADDDDGAHSCSAAPESSPRTLKHHHHHPPGARSRAFLIPPSEFRSFHPRIAHRELRISPIHFRFFFLGFFPRFSHIFRSDFIVWATGITSSKGLRFRVYLLFPEESTLENAFNALRTSRRRRQQRRHHRRGCAKAMSQRCLDFDQNVDRHPKKANHYHAGCNVVDLEPGLNDAVVRLNHARDAGVNHASIRPVPPRIPSGIGLHLNSLGMPKPQPVYEPRPAEISSADSGLAVLDEGIHLGQPTKAPKSRKRAVFEAEMTPTTTPDAKPSRKRRKSENSCKRCSCKKSRCLKLYCECFASGTYCLGSCVCLDCNNKPEFGAVVAEVRSQIRSRNPLAFGPRVVTSEGSPDTEMVEGAAAASKHKRGCNCKKSLCLKKYCECFQSEVGCSVSCKCVGCKNTYGPKQGGDDPEPETEIEAEPEPEKPKASLGLGHNFLVESPASPALLRAISAITSEGVVFNMSGHDLESSPLPAPASTCSKTSSNFHTFGTPLHSCSDLSPESRTGTPEPPASQRRMSFGRRCSSSSKPLPPGVHSLQSRALESEPSPSQDDGTHHGNDFVLAETSEVQSETPVTAATTTTTTTSSPKKKRIQVQVVKNITKLPPLLKNGRKLTLQALPSLPSVSLLRENSLKGRTTGATTGNTNTAG